MIGVRPVCLWIVLLFGTSTLVADEPLKTEPVADLHLLDPVWEGEVVHHESTVLLQEKDGGPLDRKSVV